MKSISIKLVGKKFSEVNTSKTSTKLRGSKVRRKMLTDFIELHVIEGFLGPDELVERTIIEFQDDIAREQLLPVAQKLVYQRIVKRYLEEINWVSPTDCERLDRAFLELNQMGILAKQNFSCCNSCGHKRIERALKNNAKRTRTSKHEIEVTMKSLSKQSTQSKRKGSDIWGYAFFHAQDTDDAVATGELNITFGAVDKTSEQALDIAIEVGQKIEEALKRNGLNTSWDGSYLQRVGITGIKWQRRRFPMIVQSKAV